MRDLQLAKHVPGIGLIVSGFDRVVIDPPVYLPRDVPRIQAGFQGEELGVLDLEVYDDHRGRQLKTSNVLLSRQITTDPNLASLLAHYNARADLSGVLDAMPGLDVTFPLEVHRANAEAQTAYKAAVAFPEVLMAKPAPAGLPGTETLAECFIENPDDQAYAFQYSLLALEFPACIEAANALIPELPLMQMPEKLDGSYEPGK